MLGRLGYFVNVLELDPQMFGQLTSRRRVFFVVIKMTILEAAGVSEAAAVDYLRALTSKLVGHPSLDLDEVLLSEDSPLVRDHLETVVAEARTLAVKPEAPSTSSDSSSSCGTVRGPQWPLQHAKFFERRGLDWSRPSPFRAPGARDLWPGLRELTARQIDMLEYNGLSLPHPTKALVDVNPSLGWGGKKGTMHEERAGCLSGATVHYIAHRGRCTTGVEALRLMGMFFDEEHLLSTFPAKLLRNMAGNAFDSSCFLAAWMSSQMLLSHCSAMRAGRATAAASALASSRLAIASFWEGSTDGDSDSEDI